MAQWVAQVRHSAATDTADAAPVAHPCHPQHPWRFAASLSASCLPAALQALCASLQFARKASDYTLCSCADSHPSLSALPCRTTQQLIMTANMTPCCSSRLWPPLWLSTWLPTPRALPAPTMKRGQRLMLKWLMPRLLGRARSLPLQLQRQWRRLHLHACLLLVLLLVLLVAGLQRYPWRSSPKPLGKPPRMLMHRCHQPPWLLWTPAQHPPLAPRRPRLAPCRPHQPCARWPMPRPS
jgi:hypothetical protein